VQAARVVFFFFSSRRRHTRCSRDWSSDVCSSDLKAKGTALGFGIIGLKLPLGIRRRGRTDKRSEFSLLFPKIKRVLRCAPIDVSGSERRRPLELEVAMERGLDFERLLGFHIQNNDCALRVHRNEKSLAHREGVAGVENGRGFRTHGERSGECFAGKNPAFGEEMQMKFAEDLQRIDPRLHPAGFVSEQDRKSTRLNSSHGYISYAVFCLKKKKTNS